MNVETPVVTVVVVTRNRSQVLRSCLESLIIQDYPQDRTEIVVVDDGSTDSTSDLVHEMCNGPVGMRYLRQEHQGMVKARMRGVQASRGDLIAFIDDDAIASKWWLRELVEAAKVAGVGMVGGPVFPAPSTGLVASVDANGQLIWSGFNVVPNTRFTEVDFVQGCNMAVWRAALDAIGGFDPAFGGTALREETDVSWRLKRSGRQVVFSRDASVYHSSARSSLLWQLKPYVQFSLANNHAYFVIKNLRTWRSLLYTIFVDPVRWTAFQSLRTGGLLLTFPFRVAGTFTGVVRGLMASGSKEEVKAADGGRSLK